MKNEMNHGYFHNNTIICIDTLVRLLEDLNIMYTFNQLLWI